MHILYIYKVPHHLRGVTESPWGIIYIGTKKPIPLSRSAEGEGDDKKREGRRGAEGRGNY